MIVLKSIALTLLLIGTLFFTAIEVMDMYDSFILFQLPPSCELITPAECW